MLNDPPPERRKPHPLEREPVRSSPTPDGQPPRQQVILHIPSVRPIATYTLIAINVAVFLIRALSVRIDTQILEWGANNSTLVLANGEIYRLISSMFLHASIFANQFGAYALENSVHLIFNMYALYIIGRQVERLFGHTRFTLIYLLGGLGGSVLSVALSGPNSYSVGASGAVFAVFAAWFIYLYQHRKLLGPRGRAQMQSLVIIAVMNLLVGALTAFGGPVLIDNWAHIGGLIGGLALTWMIGPIYIVRRHPEHPNELLGEDINPLRNRYWVLSVYVVVLMVILFIARSLA